MPKRCPRSTANPAEPETHIVETVKRICNRNFNIATVINLLVMTIYYLIFVTSTDYIRATYAVSLSTAGFTAGIMVIGCLVGRFISGNLLSLIGCKSVLFLGLLVHAVSLALFFIAGSLFQIFIIRFLTGLGVGVTGTATATVIAYVIPKGRQGFGIGLFSMSTALALALGPFLGIFLIRHIDYNTIMQLNFAAAFLCGAVSLSLKKLPRAAHRRRPFFHINSYTDPRVVRFSCVVLLAFLSYGCIQAFMTAFAAERGLSGPASLFFPVYAVAALASRPLTGRQLDSRGENIIFFPIFILITLGLFLLAKAATGWLLLASGLLFGLGFGNLNPKSSPEEIGRAHV